MPDFFLKVNNYIGYRNSKILGIRLFSIFRFVNRSLANLLVPLYYYLKPAFHKSSIVNSREQRLIVSITSFPDRIKRIWVVVEILLNQTMKPDKIILWLSKKQFDSLDNLPKRLLRQRSRGLEIILVDEDYRSHKKYLYSFLNFANDIIITMDDDIFYSKYTVEYLWQKHTQFPDAIVGNYVLEIEYNESGLLPYNTWKHVGDITKPSDRYFFGSGGGTLFPPGTLYQDVLKVELFTFLCPYADDVWLNAMAKLNDTFIVKTDLNNLILSLQFFRNRNLHSINLEMGENDKQIQNVVSYYSKEIKKNPFTNSRTCNYN